MARVPKAVETVNRLIKQGQFRLRVTLANLFKKQRKELPMKLIKANQGVPADTISNWQNEFADWYLARRIFWQNLFNKSVKQIQERKQTSQEIFDDLIEQRANEIGLQLSAVNTKVIDEVLRQNAEGSIQNLDRALRESIGLRPDQFSAFVKQAAVIDKNFTGAQARIMKDRLYNKKINFRAQLIARTEISTAVNEAQVADIQGRVERGDLPAAIEKKWSTVGDDRVSDECQINEEEGWVSLDDVFPSGHERPPRFPGCRCGLQFRKRPDLNPSGAAVIGRVQREQRRAERAEL